MEIHDISILHFYLGNWSVCSSIGFGMASPHTCGYMHNTIAHIITTRYSWRLMMSPFSIVILASEVCVALLNLAWLPHILGGTGINKTTTHHNNQVFLMTYDVSILHCNLGRWSVCRSSTASPHTWRYGDNNTACHDNKVFSKMVFRHIIQFVPVITQVSCKMVLKHVIQFGHVITQSIFSKVLLGVSVVNSKSNLHFDGLVQDCSNCSALAMELLQSCTKPSILPPTL